MTTNRIRGTFRPVGAWEDMGTSCSGGLRTPATYLRSFGASIEEALIISRHSLPCYEVVRQE